MQFLSRVQKSSIFRLIQTDRIQGFLLSLLFVEFKKDECELRLRLYLILSLLKICVERSNLQNITIRNL